LPIKYFKIPALSSQTFTTTLWTLTANTQNHQVNKLVP
jgi:hypothetical protein